MPVVTFDYNDFINLLGHKISKKELIENLPLIGADLDRIEKDEISIEFFPDRPDLASVEGIVRASQAFFNFETGLKKYSQQKSDIELIVDSSIKEVRPYISTALIKNVNMTDELIKSLMGLQEKLHQGLGRNRKKVAIGVHNYEPIQPPFTYKAVDPDTVQFIPLNKTDSMTMTEILRKHEKGIDYAYILKDYKNHPLIVDKNNNVLSYPPIINGSLTEVTPFTTELFIDVTGTDKKAVNYALNIVVTALAERGGKIYTTQIKDQNKTFVTPDLKPTIKKLRKDYVNKILGTSLNLKEIVKSLEKMGYHPIKQENVLKVEIPAWRADILHEIDLVEDVAIGYGYQNFETQLPKSLTFGKELENNRRNNILRNILIGLGFNEVTTFTLSNEDNEFKKLGLKKGKRAQIKNPIGEEYSCLRVGLIPSLLKILEENRHHSLPQQIFELGTIVDNKRLNKEFLSFVKIDAKANFTECKSIAEAVLRETNITYNVKDKTHPGFIKGRCAKIVSKKKEIAYFGELHPKTIKNFELEHPVIAFELYTDRI